MEESLPSVNLVRLERSVEAKSLRQWRILKYGDGSLRAAGHENRKCRPTISGPIERIDFANKLVTTSTQLMTLIGLPRGAEHGSNHNEDSGPSHFDWRCGSRAFDACDITGLLFGNGTGNALCAEVQAVADTRDFFQTIVASEEPLLWNLVRTYALMLLRRLPTQSDCTLLFGKFDGPDLTVNKTRH